MGRIIGYQYDNDIKDDDAWIGTEATSRRTKQYTAQAVADYLNINGSISIVGQMSYRYSTAPLNGIGTFAIFGGGPNTVAFSAITKLTLSNQDISEQRVVEYLDLLVGSDMIISESGQISTFGYYSIGSYAPNATDSNYYDLSVTFKSGNGAMEYGKVYETQNFTLAAEENISTLQTTIDSGNTYQVSPAQPLWTWGTDAITVTSTSFTSLLSSKRFKTTFIADGSYTDVLPNQLIFNNALGNETSITPNTALSSNIDLQWPSSSGTVALTTDITASPWDTVLGGINYAGGNVGVGATSPSAPLDVATISSGPVAKFVNTSGTGGAGVVIQAGVATSSSILTLFDYQNNERLRVRGDGNVGIGTTSPGAALEVVGGGLGARLVSINTTALEVQGGANAQDIARFKNSVGNAKFVIDTNGNVGIGTTSPDANLHIFEGSAGTFTPAASYDEFLIESDGNAGMTIASPDNRVGGIAFGTPSDSNGAYIQWNFTGSLMSIGTAKNNSDLRFVTSNNTEAVRINSSGNVGIGTTSPSVKLHVDSASVETIAYFRSTDNRGRISIADNDTTTYVISEGSKMSLGSNASLNAGNLTIDSSGKVGIGTISPSYALDVEGSLNNIAKLTSSATKSQLLFADSNTTDTVVLGSNGDNFNIRVDNGNINFQTNSGATATTRMLVNSSGQVGIGTTSPNAVLSVHNTTSTLGSRVASFYHNNGTENPFIEINSLSNGMQLKAGFTTGIAGQFDILTGGGGSFVTLSPGSSEKMRITSTGNVGIGTTSPTSKLDVAGGDIELDDVAAGIIMRSPDGTKYRITVANGGTLTVTAV